ncbi:MAG: glycosyltransferase family 2 protein [Limisphaerales bacterium]
MSPPKVSVLMPTFNYGRFLGEAIESVLAQDFKDYELIIIDDCSGDDSQAVGKHYAGRHPRFRFEVNPRNLGMVANWNRCLGAARGLYIKYLFGDDKLAGPTALGQLASMLDSDPSLALAASGRIILDERSRRLDRWAPFGATGRYPGKKGILKCLARNANLIGEPSAVLFRRDKGARGFDEDFQHLVDLEMWFHLLKQGNLAYTREALCCFRLHAGQQSKSNAARQVGESEHGRLLRKYDKPWLREETSARERFLIARYLDRSARIARDGPAAALAARYRQSVPAHWRPFFWAAGESASLSRRLRRSLGKRLWRWYYSMAPVR